MPHYFILNCTDGSVTVIDSESAPEIEANALIIHETLVRKVAKSSVSNAIPFTKAVAEQKQLAEKIKPIDMGEYGQGLASKVDVRQADGCLIYTGLLLPKSSEACVQLIRRNPDLKGWGYNIEISGGSDGQGMLLCAKEAGCLAHLSQHQPEEPLVDGSLKKHGKTYAKANMEATNITVTFTAGGETYQTILPVVKIKADKRIRAERLLGWDYGHQYWGAFKSGFVLFNPKTHQANGQVLLVGFPQDQRADLLALNQEKLSASFYPIKAEYLPDGLVPGRKRPLAVIKKMVSALNPERGLSASLAGETRALIFTVSEAQRLQQGAGHHDDAVFLVLNRKAISKPGDDYVLDYKLKDRAKFIAKCRELLTSPLSLAESDADDVQIPLDYLRDLDSEQSVLFFQLLYQMRAADDRSELTMQAPIGALQAARMTVTSALSVRDQSSEGARAVVSRDKTATHLLMS